MLRLRSPAALLLRTAAHQARITAPARGIAGEAKKRQPVLFPFDNFMTGASASYLEELYEQWKQDPNQVEPTWNAVFTKLNTQKQAGITEPLVTHFTRPSRVPLQVSGLSTQDIIDHIRVANLLRGYEVRGHLLADLDPLGYRAADLDTNVPAELEISYFGFTEADMDRVFTIGWNDRSTGFTKTGAQYTLRDLLKLLKQTYCGKIGFEYMHIADAEVTNWLRNQIQTPGGFLTSRDDKKQILKWVAQAELFEKYLGVKYLTKRFGLDGGETLIVAMQEIINEGADLGLESIVIGMPHRGRLNVLANVVGKPLESIFHEFEGFTPDHRSLADCSGDVKYHLGLSMDRETRSGKTIHLSLVANPSHLEAVNPLAEGKTRAKQFYTGDTNKTKTMTLLLHGDAAFAGQGVCYETMGMSDLKAYSTGGTVHIVVNNQIGFTTDPKDSRTSPYCSDLAKTFQAPIFHVNADYPEQVAHVAKLAIRYRQRFKRDVVIDLVCYRRYGHNETDEPSFTQPTMYKLIANHPTALKKYSQDLISEGVCTPEEVKEIEKAVTQNLKEKNESAANYRPKNKDWLETHWEGFKSLHQLSKIKNTAVPEAILKKIGQAIQKLPEGFQLHDKLKGVIKRRCESIETGEGIDWGTAEALAFGSLLLEGYHVRVSGQDVERGTFSHRHAVYHDFNTDATFKPLGHIAEGQAAFEIHNSSLSEFGVMGYELGYSLENPNSLVIWEAQFGDFANGAQTIFDQFLSSGEAKWLRQSGLVVMLPHGYDGAGPEHSSARLERFLQMCDEDEDGPIDPQRAIQLTNWQVVYCTTPANHFHVLRRQLHREFRKPLICFVSKAFLRAPNVCSIRDLTELAFREVISDSRATLLPGDQVRRLVFCSGQVWFALEEFRQKNNINDCALVRIEQLAPFPFERVAEEIDKFPHAEIVWCQEEPKNMGSWVYVRPRLHTAMGELRRDRAREMFYRSVKYCGRPPSASPATGYLSVHKKEHERLVRQAFSS
eukprot:TRINITY_DN2000_c0_g1_i1.p1 TRINITY_DN2000_c0_g1~~TRINITY_DN2000_c0_g1_i1.p1  ORF type:complete len:1001 (-),score=244.47 TRINITY_DN2000_c0_g1_i1:917-3919(-)